MDPMQKITPCLWFNGNAETAVNFYVSVFKDARIISSYPGPNNQPLMIQFVLAGTPYLALNGGADFPFTEAISLSVDCEDQAEVDELWQKLTADGGKEVECGWLKDKFGLAWQIVPRRFTELMKDSERAPRVMAALMTMVKIDIATLEQA